MIKFWKSAAKGKSGFPVRPPETNENKVSATSVILETIRENEESTMVFEKKSKLSPDLDSVLHDRNITKYFVDFMNSIGKLLLVKCWLELENFRVAVCQNKKKLNTGDGPQKITRTKSFDLDWNSVNHSSSKKGSLVGNSKENHRGFGDLSSSCQNLLENSIFLDSPSSSDITITNVTDVAVNLFKKYIALEAPQKIEVSDEIRKSVISSICQPEIDEACFQPVQDTVFQQMQVYFEEFQSSSSYIKAQIDILTNGSLKLIDILNNETILFYFTEYLEQESCRILLEYVMAVMNFRDNLLTSSNTSAEDAQQDAIIIYEKYFSLQATSPVGFTSDVRLGVESEICREGGPLYTCFDTPYKIVFHTLEGHVKTFLESEVYYKYLSEMVHSVNHMSHRRSQSDCSSDLSISTQNTLLAMGDPVHQKKKRNHSVPDMSIDSNQLYNADSLWQRSRQDGLSLGRVNSLGRFESKFEPDPDKKEKSVLKKMVSRLVPMHTSEVEEEMAWQIAHMIVKDVTDLTMAPPDNDHD